MCEACKFTRPGDEEEPLWSYSYSGGREAEGVGKMKNLQFSSEVGTITIFDNSYGDIGIMIKGPKGGEKGNILISKKEAMELADWLIQSLRNKGGLDK